MPIWMQRRFARLMKPADDAGGDLGGGSATEGALAAMGAEAPADAPTDAPTESKPDQETPAAAPTDAGAAPEGGKSRLASMLDELTDGPQPEAKAQAKTEDKPADHGPEATQRTEGEPKAAEPEEAELLEGVKSDRGRERIKQVFAEKKQLETQVQQIRELVQSSGMSAQEFAQSLEFGRLVSSGDEKNLRVALEMIEGQRAMLYQKLGVEAPGVDLLQGHGDLKQAVENMEITRERALELAKYRQQQAELQQRQQVQQQQVQQQQAFEQRLAQAAGAMQTYLATRSGEADHAARLQALQAHFANPAAVQSFVQTFEPQQWPAVLQMMYDGVTAPPKAATAQPMPQPLRARASTLGAPAAQGGSPIARLAQHLDNMGL